MDEQAMKGLNLAFRFVLEMLVLVALFLFGWALTDSLPAQLVLGFGLPAIVVVLWGLFVAPKASRRLEDPVRLAVELVIWFAGALAFGLAVSWIVALLFGLAVLLNLVLMFYWGQRGK